jgi:aerobic carbon-monoxide dehydrogenase large subunit
MLHAAFLRSPVAHARVVRIDTEAARQAPGVVAVYVGTDVEPHLTPGPYHTAILVPPGPPLHSCLATDKVRMVGDPIAMVVAESRYGAEDAVELIDVDYEMLPPITQSSQALDPGSPHIFGSMGSNVLVSPQVSSYGDVEGVFAAADRILRASLQQHRIQNMPMETRGCVAQYDHATQRLEVWSGNQSVRYQRDSLASRLGMPPECIRVRAADIGGSFGLKTGASREDVAVAFASTRLGRPVKYIEDRYEHLTASGQAREESFDVEVAYTNEGRMLGIKATMVMDTGSYPGIGTGLPYFIEAMLPGPYRLAAYRFEFTCVVTNKASYVPYRGPWAAETFVRERIIDLLARDLGREPLEIRRMNVVKAQDQPASMITGRTLRGITVDASLDRIAEQIDLDDFRTAQAAARAKGRYLGIGMASYIEAAPGPRNDDQPLGSEPMQMYVDRTGTVVVVTGQMPHGQSHETTLAQVAADEMGVRFDQVRVVYGDSDVVPSAHTGASRGAAMAGGAALHSARALKRKVLEAAADVFEASAEDLQLDQGRISVSGVPARAMSLAEVVASLPGDAERAGGPSPGLWVDLHYDGGAGGWSGGTHCAVVDVDTGTGLVQVLRYLVVHDCGVLINPAVVTGQIRGGVAQGIGAVLLERSAYDAEGNCLSATLMDYLLPTTVDVPRIEVTHLETIALDPDVNFRGVGEGGMIVSPVTVCNAIEDALAPLGGLVYEQHLPPVRILELAGVLPRQGASSHLN